METILEALFLKILNMSLTASYVIIAVMAMRLLLKKAPKKYSYALWAAAAFRLVCPVSFESIFSLFSLKSFNLNVQTASAGTAEIVHIPENIGFMAQPEIATGITAVNRVVNPLLPAATPQVSVNPLQIWIFIGTILWCLGIAALILFSAVNLIRLRRRLAGATILRENIWQSEKVRSPFILGIVRPKIYIPYGLREDELGYVLEHERSHIRRGDHIIKILAFLILCLHWFNPLVWLAYCMMGKDMEQSCDERVLSRAPDISAKYSTTLLSFASNRRFPAPTPLAFGETGVKARIKNALRWKKPRLWVSIAALILCIAVVIACTANPKDEPSGHALKETEPVALEGTYVPWDCVHQHPAISARPKAGNNGNKYVFEDGAMTIIDRVAGKPTAEFELAEAWQEFPWSDEEWEDMLMLPTDFYVPLSQQYVSVLYCPLDGEDQFLMLADGQLWIVNSYTESDGSRYITGIYSLVSENSPCAWTSTLNVSDIRGFNTNLEVDFGGGFDMESSLTDILNELSPEAFSTGRGYPGEYFVTIKTDDESSFTLRRGPDFIELSIEGPAAELYRNETGVWEIRSDELLYWFDCFVPSP